MEIPQEKAFFARLFGPRTGKTKVVSRIIEGCYRQGHRVLFVAPTNVAVDQALERICELLSAEAGFGDGLVQRAGDLAVKSLAEKFGDAVMPKRIAERLSAALYRQREEIAERLAQIQAAVDLHERATVLAQERNRLQSVIANSGQESERLAGGLRTIHAQIEKDQRDADEIGIPAGIFAHRKQLRLDELRRKIANDQAVEAQLRQRLQASGRDEKVAAKELAVVEPALREAQHQLNGLPPLEVLRGAATQLAEKQKGIDEQLSKIGDAVRSRCRVLGTTVAKAVQSRKLLDTVDVVVIDEAGMVDLPSAWYIAGLAGRRVVVAGDFRQLPAVTKGSGDRRASPQDQAHSREWMDRDVFHAAGLVDASGSVRRDDRLVALVEQYRMRPAICAVVNTVAYPDAP
ncbi:AAA domain-containing protein [Nonomuraea sp. NPDC049158]|uniref:AAA domain-containing protein n=1 Tax=Nonomuraea sp. NPDC049158 TaxID=3155649 RepID=UPI0033D13633